MVLAVDGLMMAVLEDGDRTIRFGRLKLGLNGRPMGRGDVSTSTVILLQQSTRTLAAMPATAALFFGNNGKVCSGCLSDRSIVEAILDLVFCLA
jgi:hypothetical protein